MIDQAIQKITNQIESATDPMEKMLGQQIIDNITTNSRAGKVLVEGKSLSGCKKEFDSYASKNKKGNTSIIGPKQAEELIISYFGFENDEAINHRDLRRSEQVIDISKFI